MLKPRIAGVLVVLDGQVVQSIGFRRHLPVGSPEICAEFLNAWGIDEIILLDIGAARERRRPDPDLVGRVSARCVVPLAVGGGVRDIADMRALIRGGADKIVINTSALERPGLIEEAARVFGSQCIVVSMDARAREDGRYEVFARCGRNATGLEPVEWARRAESLGAGEIFLNSVDRDGSKAGYDLGLIRQVADSVSLPVVACGGVGHASHFAPAFREGLASAAAAANFFHFSEHSVNVAKARLRQDGIPMRGDLHADYAEAALGLDGRVAKKDDAVLEKLRFKFHPKEII